MALELVHSECQIVQLSSVARLVSHSPWVWLALLPGRCIVA